MENKIMPSFGTVPSGHQKLPGEYINTIRLADVEKEPTA